MLLEKIGMDTIKIAGNIKTQDDLLEIKDAVNSMKTGAAKLTIEIVDSLSMPSSVIGFFVKAVAQDKINIQMKVRNKKLKELLESLDLTNIFNIY